ncbi:MAG: hypothetical protein L0387_06815, partial [Acidobacteria bacterium]|nr:hypothetical protein [Acidobacteriota bacterium]
GTPVPRGMGILPMLQQLPAAGGAASGRSEAGGTPALPGWLLPPEQEAAQYLHHWLTPAVG